VYVEDIVITRNDETKVAQLKQHLCSNFQNKDLRCPKYFLGIEVTQSKGIVISQRIYKLDLLKERDMIDCILVDGPMDPNQELMAKQRKPFSYPEIYTRLIRKLIYLTIIRSDLSFEIDGISQFMHVPRIDH